MRSYTYRRLESKTAYFPHAKFGAQNGAFCWLFGNAISRGFFVHPGMAARAASTRGRYLPLLGAKGSVGSSHGVPAIANAMETPLSHNNARINDLDGRTTKACGSSVDEGQRPSHRPRCDRQYDRGCKHQTQQTE